MKRDASKVLRQRVRLGVIIKSAALGGVLLLGLFAFAHKATAGMWDDIMSAYHEGEKQSAFCAEHPTDDRCKPLAASTLLIRCESSLPESLGNCTGALHAYALDGIDLAAWQCVPHATLQDYEQLRRLFIREANRMPEVLHLPARQLLYYAVAKAFPCRFQPDQIPR